MTRKSNPDSLRQQVLREVRLLPSADARDLAPRLPHLSLFAIRFTLNELKRHGFLEVVEPSRALGRGRGRTLARFVALCVPRAKPLPPVQEHPA